MNKFLAGYCFIAIFWACIAYAEPKASIPLLKPYAALYESQIKGVNIIFKRQLSIVDDTQLLLTLRGQKFFFEVSEISRFVQKGKILIPISYEYAFNGIVRRRKEIQFMNSSDTINSFEKGKWFELPKEEGILDRLSVQEQLRVFLMGLEEIPKRVSFRVADGSRIKDYKFIYLGKEILGTNIGNKKTIRFAREFKDSSRVDEVWLAPDMDFLILKHIHIEDGTSNEATLLNVTIKDLKTEKQEETAAMLLEG